MMLTLIAAVARNRAIGYRNELLYHIAEDLQRFKQLTTGHTIIMGRKTFGSLPKGALPNRRNVVVSTTVSTLPGCEVYASIDDALGECADDTEIFVIGGESIYRQTIDRADRLMLTEIDDEPESADAFFPEYKEWKEVGKEPRDGYAFVEYVRR